MLPTNGKDGGREAGLCVSEASKEHFLISLLNQKMIYVYLHYYMDGTHFWLIVNQNWLISEGREQPVEWGLGALR